MKTKLMLTIILIVTLVCTVSIFSKPKITVYWALYDGLTEEYRANLQDAFNAANSDCEVDIVPVAWDALHDKLVTAVAAKNPPELSIVGTRWLLEFMSMNAIEEVTPYVGKETLANIAPGAMEAKIKGKLMGLPVAAGARILAINSDITTIVPKTMEQLRTEAIKITKDGKGYGWITPGKKHTELTDFVYFLYAAGGDFFEVKKDGSYGKCIVNNAAGVKALTMMVQMANKDKVVENGYTSLNRYEALPIFYAGKAGYVMIGAWVDSELKQAKATFKPIYAQIPGFSGKKSTPLIVTDSIAVFKEAKNKQYAKKFLDFYYKDEWKAKFDSLVGFPPVTISAAKLPEFQTDIYKALGEAAKNAKGWPLIENLDEYTSTIWDAVQKAYLGEKTPKAALDEAAKKIDESRSL